MRHFARVRICSSVGFEVYGTLNSVSRAGIQVLTPLAVPIRCPLEITIAGCRSFNAEAFYCLKRSEGHQVGIVFVSPERPHMALGALATVNALAELEAGARGSVVDVGKSSVSILCKTSIAPGTEVRLEVADWVFFGVVRTVVATSMIGKCLEIHLQAAFAANPSQEVPEQRTDSCAQSKTEGAE